MSEPEVARHERSWTQDHQLIALETDAGSIVDGYEHGFRVFCCLIGPCDAPLERPGTGSASTTSRTTALYTAASGHDDADENIRELLDFAADHDDVHLLLEPIGVTAKRLRSYIRSYIEGLDPSVAERCTIVFPDVAFATQFRASAPHAHIAARFLPVQADAWQAVLEAAIRSGIEALLVGQDPSRTFLESCKHAGLEVVVVGLDNPDATKNALALGASAVATHSVTPERLKRSYEVTLTELVTQQDSRGNRIFYDGTTPPDTVSIRIRGRNNTLIVHRDARMSLLRAIFDNDNARIEIGSTRRGIPKLAVSMRAGQDSSIQIGNDVTTTHRVFISAVEGASVTIGDDVMFASENEVRADDAHAIYDVDSGDRVNPARSVRIGNHVWLAREAVVLGGVTIGDGSVLGYRSLVTRSLPNNCVAAGVPARVIRKNVAWERMHLDDFPPYKPSASLVPKSEYWSQTAE